MFSGGPAQYTLGYPHPRSVVSGSAGCGRRHGHTVPKNRKPMNKGGITARNRPVHIPGGKGEHVGVLGGWQVPVLRSSHATGRHREIDIHAGGVGCALAKRDDKAVKGRGGVFTRHEMLQKGHFHRKHSVTPVVCRGPSWQDPLTLGTSLVVHSWYSGPTCRQGKTGGGTHGVAAGRGGGVGIRSHVGASGCRAGDESAVHMGVAYYLCRAAGRPGEQCSGKQRSQTAASGKTRLCRGQGRAWMHHLGQRPPLRQLHRSMGL